MTENTENFESRREKLASRRLGQGPKFPLGSVFETTNASEKLHPADKLPALDRHMRGDWGDICQEDWELNDASLKLGSRLLSVYRDRAGERFWIITEADRSTTTILLPEDY